MVGINQGGKGERMDQAKIIKIQKLSDALRNFNDCYADCVLWGSCPDGDVHREQMLSWLIENPHMGEIAKQINELDT